MRALMFTLAAAGVGGCYLAEPAERCNSVDDDGDGLIDEDFPVGKPCDGSDSDACTDATLACAPGGFEVECVDSGEEHLEICNAVDDNCDGDIDEGFEIERDIENCGGCGLACVNRNGPTECSAGACEFSCDPGAQDCNLDPYDGCEVALDGDPVCDDAVDLGSIPGDTFGDFTYTGAGEGWVVVFIDEVSTVDRHISATIELESPPGMNFDLHLYCETCGSDAPIRSSELPGDQLDVIDYGRADVAFVNDGRAVFVEVRHAEGVDTCAEWTLRVTGGTDVFEQTCTAQP